MDRKFAEFANFIERLQYFYKARLHVSLGF